MPRAQCVSAGLQEVLGMRRIETVTVVGMGALGTLYGRTLQKTLGIDKVCFLMDEERLARALRHPVLVNGKEEAFRRIGPKDAAPADLILVAVKGPGLLSAMETMAPAVGPETIIISALNGVTSEELLGSRFGKEHVIPCVAQGMDATFFDYRLRFQKHGQLCLGLFEEEDGPAAAPARVIPAAGQAPAAASMRDKLEAVAELFERTGVPYVIEKDIRHRMYSKWMLNCGLNQACMVFETTYGGVVEEGSLPMAIFYAAMREAMLIANAEGAKITEEDLSDYAALTKSLTPDSMPSMAQDRKNKKASEVDLFAGTVLRLAKKHGIEVPVNAWLRQQVLEIESQYSVRDF